MTPLDFHMPTMADLVAEYADCWFLANGKGNPPACEQGINIIDFCVGAADNVHDTYIDCTMAFACDFEGALAAHILEKGK